MSAEARDGKNGGVVAGDKLPFGELAMLLGYISREELRYALRDQVLGSQKIGTILIQRRLITREQAKNVLRLQKNRGPIEGFVLEQRIGSGGMGTIFKATQKSLNRRVAVKILSTEVADSPTQRRRFVQEAHLLAQLQHPNLVQCYDIGESSGLVYIVMELVEGRNGRELLEEQGPYSQDLASALIAHCLEGMGHYHAKQIIHRDLKPENILVTENKIAKLADLGLSKQLTNDMFLTRVGKTVGTPLYISPELAQGDTDVDIRADIYSLGATFYHLCCGRPPFVGSSAVDILTKHVQESPIRPSKLNRSLSRPFEQLLLKMLEKSPKKRFATPADALAELHAIEERRSAGSHAPATRRRSSGTTATATLRGSGSGVHKRASASRADRQGSAVRRAPKVAPPTSSKRWVVGLVLLLVLSLGYGLGWLSVDYQVPAASSTAASDLVATQLDREREAIEAGLSTLPGRTITDLERWSEHSEDATEAILRWKLVLKHRRRLGPELTKQAESGLSAAQRALEEEASDRFSEIADAVYELLDANKIDEARAKLASFPETYRETIAWADWESLLGEIGE